MNKSILNSTIAAAIAIGLAACSSGGSDVAGIGGSGVTSSGTITGFGSIFVNGVEFETGSSTISVDDNPGLESDLAIGMRVTVEGTVNADGVTGTATSVSFDDDLQGPVGTITENPDQTIKTFSVLGRTVNISSTNTSFDKSGSNPALAGVTFDYANITAGQYVEISGFLDSNGVMITTRIELKDTAFDFANELVEIRGTVTGLSSINETFTLVDTTNLTIDTSSNPIIDNDLPGGLVDGAFVEVKGLCSDVNCTTLVASKIENGLEGFDDNDDVEIEGVITRYDSDSDFDVNGFPVNASNATKEPTTLTLAVDKQVEVEGTIVNGVLIASKVEDEGGEIMIAATVTAVDPSAGSFELSPVSGEPSITVMIDTSTKIEDDIGTFNSAALLDNLNPGSDYVVVEGYDDGTGTVIASEVKRESPDDVIVQGVMDSFDVGGQVTVLGVSFGIDSPPGETDFEDANDATISEAVFDANTTDGVTLIKVKDKTATNGVADEVEIETP